MNRFKQTVALALLLLVLLSFASAKDNLCFKLTKKHEVGHTTPLFASVFALCEDRDANYYIADAKVSRVYRFSPQGILLVTFGREGQGPGDLYQPMSIAISPKNQLVICERNNYISIFSTGGQLIEKINGNNLLPLASFFKYAGEDLFYAEKMDHSGRWDQVLLNRKGEIINRSLFFSRNTAKVTKSSGPKRVTSFGIHNEIYTPRLLFSYHKKLSAAAVTTGYDIALLDGKGKVVRRIKRDVGPALLSANERDYLKEMIMKNERFPKDIRRELTYQVPFEKNIFRKIFITGKYIMAFRIVADITDKKDSAPVDIFSISGTYLGSAQLERVPIFISDKHIYFPKYSDEEELLVVKYSYELEENLQ